MTIEDTTARVVTIAGTLAAAVVSMVNLVQELAAPGEMTGRRRLRLGIETICSPISGGIGARYFGPVVVHMLGITNDDWKGFVGFVVGAGFWAFVPVLTRMSVKLNTRIAGLAGKGLPPEDEEEKKE